MIELQFLRRTAGSKIFLLVMGLLFTNILTRQTEAVSEQVGTVTVDRTDTTFDADGDGMGDEWETLNGLNPANAADAAGDEDGDGVSNLEEFRRGTVAANVIIGITSNETIALERTGEATEITVHRSGALVPVRIKLQVSPAPGDVAQASLEDFTLYGDDGNPLSSLELFFTERETSKIVRVLASQDDVEEVIERFTLEPEVSEAWVIDSAASQVVVRLAEDAPLYSGRRARVFVAPQKAETDVVTQASGIAVILVRADNEEAKVSYFFNGLEGTQTAAHFHVATGTRGPVVKSLPLGELENEIWNLEPTEGLENRQAVLDALVQEKFYASIKTDAHPSGELYGFFQQADASFLFDPPEDPAAIPSYEGDALEMDIARFLIQATFGARRSDIDALLESVAQNGGDRMQAFEGWIDTQLGLGSQDVRAFADVENGRRDRTAGHEGTMHAFWTHAIYGRNQLRQRMAFALSQILVASAEGQEVLRSDPAAMPAWAQIFLDGSLGSYRDLLEEVTLSPVMGVYLSHLNNTKALYDSEGNLLTFPDENFAREVMQLFSIGLIELHPDGSIQLDFDENPFETYSNEDIQTLARVFTGYTFSELKDGSVPNNLPAPELGRFDLQMAVNNLAYKDTDEKQMFQGDLIVPANTTPNEELRIVLDYLASHPNVAPFISFRLIQRFVTSNPSRGYVYRVSQVFEESEGDLGRVVKAILLDPEARNLGTAMSQSFGKPREPLLRASAALRLLGVSSTRALIGDQQSDLLEANARILDLRYLHNTGSFAPDLGQLDRKWFIYPFIGQSPWMAPTVFNWYEPTYRAPGPLANNGYNSPEFALTTTANETKRVNAFYQLIYEDWHSPDRAGVTQTNLNPFTQLYDQRNAETGDRRAAAEAVLREIDLIFAGGALQRAADNGSGESFTYLREDFNLESVALTVTQEALYLIFNAPEAIVQR